MINASVRISYSPRSIRNRDPSPLLAEILRINVELSDMMEEHGGRAAISVARSRLHHEARCHSRAELCSRGGQARLIEAHRDQFTELGRTS